MLPVDSPAAAGPQGERDAAGPCPPIVQLDAQLYRSVVSQLHGDDRNDKGTAKRSEPRVGLRAWANLIRVHCDDSGYRYERLRADVTDLSWGGIRLILPEALDRGDTFLMHLPSDTSGPLFVKYVATHVVPVDQNRLFAIGAKAIGVFEVGHGELTLKCGEVAPDGKDIDAPRVSEKIRAALTKDKSATASKPAAA